MVGAPWDGNNQPHHPQGAPKTIFPMKDRSENSAARSGADNMALYFPPAGMTVLFCEVPAGEAHEPGYCGVGGVVIGIGDA